MPYEAYSYREKVRLTSTHSRTYLLNRIPSASYGLNTGWPRKKNETAAFSGFVLQQESLDILQSNPIMTFVIGIIFLKQNKYITQQEYVTFLSIMLHGHNAFPL